MLEADPSFGKWLVDQNNLTFILIVDTSMIVHKRWDYVLIPGAPSRLFNDRGGMTEVRNLYPKNHKVLQKNLSTLNNPYIFSIYSQKIPHQQ